MKKVLISIALFLIFTGCSSSKVEVLKTDEVQIGDFEIISGIEMEEDEVQTSEPIESAIEENGDIGESEEHIEVEEIVEEEVEVQEKIEVKQSSDSSNSEASKPSTEKKETKNTRVKNPTYNKLPEDAIFEALITTTNGATIFDQPNRSAKNVTKLQFGDLVWAIRSKDNWTYIYHLGNEGWVENSTFRKIPYDSTKKTVVDNPNDILVLVNKHFKLPSNYKPKDLVLVNVAFPFGGKPESKFMRKEAAKALEKMFKAAKEDGIELFATSGYRSFARQKEIFTGHVNRVGFKEANSFSAFPGESEHQTGLAMDVTSKRVNFALTVEFGRTKEGIWIEENAHKFGYIIRYLKGKEKTTGYIYEPWHLRYVGKDAAKDIYERGITLEEYLGKVK